MKKGWMIKLLLVSLCLPLVCASALSEGEGLAAPEITITAGDAVIRLPGNETTGYVWTAASGDEAVLALTAGEYIPDEAPEGMAGVGGVSRFTLKAGKSGSAVVDLTWKRPWEEFAEAARTILFDVDAAGRVTGVCLQGDETLRIMLDENPSTGFLWTFALSAQGVYDLTEDAYIPAEGGDGLAGAGGTRVLAFKPVSRGDTLLMLSLSRGEEIAETRVFTLSCDYDIETLD